jgi:hypothetical protein
VRGRNPIVSGGPNHTRIAHTEEFAPVVTSSTAFKVDTYQINPALAVCFPWLSAIAARYQFYKFRRLRFRYISTSPTSLAGYINMDVDFNVLDPAPATMAISRSYHDKAGGGVWHEWTLDVDLAQGDRTPEKYTRVGLPSGTTDLKTYDLGNLHVCTEGTAGSTLGFIECEYMVDLMTPQIADPVGGATTYTSTDNTHMFVAEVDDPQSILPYTVPTDGTNVLTFTQNWEGIVCFYITGTVLSAFTVTGGGTPGYSIAIQDAIVINAAATKLSAMVVVRAYPGSTMTCTLTGTTVTQTKVYAASGGNRALNNAVTLSLKAAKSSPSSSSSSSSSSSLLTQSMIDEAIASRRRVH